MRLTPWIAALSIGGWMTAVSAQVVTIRGPVITSDPDRAIIAVQDQSQGKTLIMHVPQQQPSVVISPDGRLISLGEIQPGQLVEIRHQEVDGRDVAQQIQILPSSGSVVIPTEPVTIPSPVVTIPPATAATQIDTGTGTTQIIAPALPSSPVTVVNVERWGPGDKLIRGLANLVFGFVEIPRNIFNTSQEDNILAGLTVGTFKGVGYTVARMGAGAYDTVTFFLPLPAGYRPLIQPEFPWPHSGVSGAVLE